MENKNLHCSVNPDQANHFVKPWRSAPPNRQSQGPARPRVCDLRDTYENPIRGHAPRLVGQDIWVITDGKIQERNERRKATMNRRPLDLALESEDIKGARRMPWRRKPKKGAASGDTPRGGADGLRSGGARMGEPSGDHAPLPLDEHIVEEEATRGTETSQYPEEEKSTEIPGVAASGTGRTPKPARATRPQPCPAGVAGRATGACGAPGEVTNRGGSGTAWEGRPQRVRAPYAKPPRPRARP